MNIKLKSVIHDTPTNSVEATWVDEIAPAYDVPESVAPDTQDKDGNVIPGEVIPAHTVPAVEVNVKCHSYHETQMDWLEADLGADLPDYADLIATVRSKIVPYVPPPLTPADVETALDALFDMTAQSRRYKDRITCSLRAGYPGPFQAEGIAFATWMDTQNAKAYQMMAQVQSGTMPMPSTVEAALALLDPMVWPV